MLHTAETARLLPLLPRRCLGAQVCEVALASGVTRVSLSPGRPYRAAVSLISTCPVLVTLDASKRVVPLPSVDIKRARSVLLSTQKKLGVLGGACVDACCCCSHAPASPCRSAALPRTAVRRARLRLRLLVCAAAAGGGRPEVTTDSSVAGVALLSVSGGEVLLGQLRGLVSVYDATAEQPALLDVIKVRAMGRGDACCVGRCYLRGGC